MLQTQSVYPATLGLLKKLMNLPPLASFNLVGGTALALQFGYRISVDLDLFTEHVFNTEVLQSAIEQFANEEHYTLKWEMVADVSLSGTIDGVRVDMIHFPYPLIDDLVYEGEIRMLSPKDIAPMKLSAIAKRGVKKDFFDMYELLKRYSLDEMLQFYQQKFPYTDTTFLLRALLYFDDAEREEDPIMLKSYTWKDVKKEMTKQVHSFFERQV